MRRRLAKGDFNAHGMSNREITLIIAKASGRKDSSIIERLLPDMCKDIQAEIDINSKKEKNRQEWCDEYLHGARQ